jgi:Icc-related predicted phosphoesterase
MTRVVLVSDTHGRHRRLVVPACDVLVHCGDFSRRGRREELDDVLDWLAAQPARERVLVAGNHDFCAEKDPAGTRAACAAAGVRYLEDEGAEVAGLSVWGSPMTPAFHSLAFNRERGAAIRQHWDRIPAALDLLVTHGPPRGLGDRVFFGMHVGCDDLLARVRRTPPRVHAYGHIHEARGEYRLPGLPTRFLNVATVPLLFGAPRPPVVVDL